MQIYQNTGSATLLCKLGVKLMQQLDSLMTLSATGEAEANLLIITKKINVSMGLGYSNVLFCS